MTEEIPISTNQPISSENRYYSMYHIEVTALLFSILGKILLTNVD